MEAKYNQFIHNSESSLESSYHHPGERQNYDWQQSFKYLQERELKNILIKINLSIKKITNKELYLPLQSTSHLVMTCKDRQGKFA